MHIEDPIRGSAVRGRSSPDEKLRRLEMPFDVVVCLVGRRHRVGGDGRRAGGEGSRSVRLDVVVGERRRRQRARVRAARLLQQVGRPDRCPTRVASNQRLQHRLRRSSPSVYR